MYYGSKCVALNPIRPIKSYVLTVINQHFMYSTHAKFAELCILYIHKMAIKVKESHNISTLSQYYQYTCQKFAPSQIRSHEAGRWGQGWSHTGCDWRYPYESCWYVTLWPPCDNLHVVATLWYYFPLYCIHKNFCQEKISPMQDCIEDNIMATSTALAKIFSMNFFCNTEVAGLGEIFIYTRHL